MNFDLTEEQEMIVESVAKFVATDSPVSRFRKTRNTDRGWDTAVLCTLGETLSMAILEAWALGLPLISNDVPGVGDLIQNNHDGLLVGPSHPALLTERIQLLVNDAPLRRKLGKNGRKRVEDHFNRKTIWSQYERLIQHLKPHGVNALKFTTEKPKYLHR